MSEEAIDCSLRASFPNARIMAKIDLLRTDVEGGDVGQAEGAWTALWEEAADLKGWHEWLARGRLLIVKADLLLALKKPEEAAETAISALAHWRRYRRPKYEAAGHAVLGRAELALGRPAAGVRELQRAVEIAERLGHPPTLWQASGKLVTALRAVGDDDKAAGVQAQVVSMIEKFAGGLSDEHRADFLAAERVREALHTSG
jgi:tetratricopeptide (TPR) repeat protein